MNFDNYDQLKHYLSQWLENSEIETIWNWLKNGMITENKIVEITEKCCCDKECMENSMRHNAWTTFIKAQVKY